VGRLHPIEHFLNHPKDGKDLRNSIYKRNLGYIYNMPKKKRSVEPEKETIDYSTMHEKNKVTIDIKKTWLEEIALLLGEFYESHDQFQKEQNKRRL